MRMIIKGGRVIDPGNIDGVRDILIEDGIITQIEENIIDYNQDKTDSCEIIDASGLIVVPGLIDMHVHLREPGHEYKETIKSGSLAAARGGFTAICPMPNTNPVNDNRQVTEFILTKAAEADAVRVYPVAGISKGLNGNRLSEYGELKDAGVIAVSDDGKPVNNSLLMRRAMEYAKGFGLPVISHCEDLELAADGVMNEGPVSTRMGLAGIPNAAESVMVMRDISLCELTGSALHIAHVSTSESVHAIRDAKERGVAVTAETAPHYFTLIDESVYDYNTSAKMNPPLRSSEDRESILKGLKDGTIDVIATDHAPHSALEKDVEFNNSANGIIGLETSLPLSLRLVENGTLSIEQLIDKMSGNPARILGLDNGIKVGKTADITIIDTENTFIVNASEFLSLGRNTPFDGWELKGRAVFTIVGGRIVFKDK
ncbi:MAG: dihydroorotase [Desulfobacterales bacterium]|jgi:dihydroorotase|nr:dihydroorotase [Desulfobacteraceae bacterium]MBT7697166.1 dihydroorotase [Desulfobacterales bacterium]